MNNIFNIFSKVYRSLWGKGVYLLITTSFVSKTNYIFTTNADHVTTARNIGDGGVQPYDNTMIPIKSNFIGRNVINCSNLPQRKVD